MGVFAAGQPIRAKLSANAILGHLSWVTAAFVVVQVMRLGSNIVLAYLLTPAIFGVMTLINTLRTGVELLSDIGIGQNIVIAKAGDQPDFFNTAWTLQILRGAVLTAIGVAAAWPLARIYEQPALFALLAVSSSIFFLSGLHTPARFLMVRRRESRRLAIIEAIFAAFGMVCSIGFALVMPNAWGMVWAMVVSTALTAAYTFFLMDLRTLKLVIKREHFRSILSFGKWLLISSLVYFIATNFERLYLPLQVPLALFGVYGIARTIGDAGILLMQRIGGMVILPAVAEQSGTFHARLPRLTKMRRWGLALISIGIGAGVATGDLFIDFAYDDRYAAAQIILPLLLVGTWFSVQAVMAESILLGLSRPAQALTGNAAKLIWIVALLPLAFTWWGLLAGLVVIALADVPRYAVLLIAQHRARLRFLVQDAGLLVLATLVAVLARYALVALGVVDGLITAAQWRQIAVLIP